MMGYFIKIYPLLFAIMVVLSSVNVNGVSDFNKFDLVLQFCKNNHHDIICLQETFWDKQISDHFQNKIASDFHLFYNNCTNPARRRGVAILVRKRSEVKILGHQCDSAGRIISMQIQISHQNINIINVYSPTQPYQRTQFWKDLSHFFLDNYLHIVIGDFNTKINPHLDQSYSVINHVDPSRKHLLDFIAHFSLVDVWRKQHPHVRESTWRRQPNGILQQSRIDYALIHESLVHMCQSSHIVHFPYSDHDLIQFKFNFHNSPRGPGVWAFNKHLLTDEVFVNNISDIINESKLDPNYTCNKIQWWGSLKHQIRRFSQKYAKQQAKLRRHLRKTLEKKLKWELTKANRFVNYDLTNARIIQEELDNIISLETQGALIRSKIQWYEEGEKSTKFFFNLEKSKQEKKCIKSLIDDKNEILTDITDIISEAHNFYTNLYDNEPCDLQLQNTFLGYITDTVSEEECAAADSGLSVEEVTFALSKCIHNKSPGADGLPYEFYLHFWEDIKDDLLDIFNCIFNNNILPDEWKTGLITLIPKADSDPRYIKNWRPITLLNCDYKILTKTLAIRLNKIMPSIVSPDQTCCVPGRDIVDNVFCMRDLIHHAESSNSPGAILKFDQMKAFDRVDHKYLLNTLRAFRFGDNFVKWISILYNQVQSNVKINGFLSDSVLIKRSVRQGCPLSAMLYVLSAEPLNAAIKLNHNIHGIKIPGILSSLVYQHADDTTLTVSDDHSIREAYQVFCDYGKASGSKVNLNKSALMWIGNNRGRTDCPLPIKLQPDGMVILGVMLSHDSSFSDEYNWTHRIPKICNILKSWSLRKLSYKGKALIINSLITSTLWYRASVVSLPSQHIKILNEHICNFFWSSGHHHVKFDVITSDIKEGGLKVTNIQDKVHALRLKWLCKLLNKNYVHKFKQFFIYNLNKYLDLNCGVDTFKMLLYPATLRQLPTFYRELFQSWSHLFSSTRAQPNSYDEVINEPIFDNPFITSVDGRPLPVKNLFTSSGIVKIRDLLYEVIPGFLPVDAIDDMVSLAHPYTPTTNTVEKLYHSILNSIPQDWFDNLQSKYKDYNEVDKNPSLFIVNDLDQRVPFHSLNVKIITTIARNLRKTVPTGVQYWLSHLPNVDFSLVWPLIYTNFKDNYLGDLDYLISHNAVFTNHRLYKAGKIVSPKCDFCTFFPEDVYHLFVCCQTIQSLWQFVFEIIYSTCNVNKFTTRDSILMMLFGYSVKDDRYEYTLINILLSLSRYTIHSRRLAYKHCTRQIDLVSYFKYKLKQKINFEYKRCKATDDAALFGSIFAQNNVLVTMDDVDFTFNF